MTKKVIPSWNILLIALGPFFECFFNLGGPRGTQHKKLQNLGSMQLVGGFGGIRSMHVMGFHRYVVAPWYMKDCIVGLNAITTKQIF